MSEKYEPNEFEFKTLENYFQKFIEDRVYFRIRTLAINFISDNTSLTYKQASENDGLLGLVMRFSKITTKAKREKIIRKYNTNTYQVVKNVK